MVDIAIVGDIHHHFTQFDVEYFNSSSYDLLLCTGDLPYHGSQKDKQIVSRLAALHKPVLLIPGNHDCVSMAQFLAEVKGLSWLSNRSATGQQKLVVELRKGLEPVVMCGYSGHEFSINGMEFCVIAARPLSFGGPGLSYERYLQANFGVDSLQASAVRLQELVDAAGPAKLIFLSHNGPTGLGSRAGDIWGCDFKPEAGDCGDPDLERAIGYAKEIGKEVTAVIAGHMHHALLSGGNRRWIIEKDGTTYVNAAYVPRILQMGDQISHHHIHLRLDTENVFVEELLVPGH